MSEAVPEEVRLVARKDLRLPLESTETCRMYDSSVVSGNGRAPWWCLPPTFETFSLRITGSIELVHAFFAWDSAVLSCPLGAFLATGSAFDCDRIFMTSRKSAVF